MTEKAPFFFWGDEWIESQRNYWEAWSRLCRQALDSASKPTPLHRPWAESLDNWWKALSPGIPEQTHEFVERLIGQGKTFFQWSEEFTRLISTLSEPSKSAGSWQEVLQSWIEKSQAPFSQPHSAEASSARRGRLPLFELPMDTWTRTLSSSSLLPGDFLQALKPEGLQQVTAELHDRIGRFLSVPGVGYAREWQEQLQRTARLILDYQRALQEYTNAHGKLEIDMLERLLKKLIERAEKGDVIKSLREIYDLWVDCCEEAYNGFVFTDEYADIYGRLVNALMALKHQTQNLMDEIVGALNMPTRKGMTTLRFRQQELRRELIAIRSRLEKMEVERIGVKLKALQDEVSKADLKGLRADLNAANTIDLWNELKAIRADVDNVAAVRRELEALRTELNALKASLVTNQASAFEPQSLGNPGAAASLPPKAAPLETPTSRRTKPPRRTKAKGG